MTRHSSKQAAHQNARQRPQVWVWLTGFSTLLVVVLVVISGIRSAVTAPRPQVTGAPRLSVEQATFDYGDLRYGTQVTAVFRIHNIGDHDLKILEAPTVEVFAGCCPPRALLSSSVIAPGEEATITLTFTMHEGMGGPHHFNIDLQTNDPSEPVKQLTVLSNWVA